MTIGFSGVCSRFIGDLVHVLRVAKQSSSTNENPKQENNVIKASPPPTLTLEDDLMSKALTTVFGMENNGKIKKEKARQVVDKLGLLYNIEEDGGAILDANEEVLVEEVIGDCLKDKRGRHELLIEAFKIFDEDGNGYIEASELKRVLECLGLDHGLDMEEVEKMLKVVDLNFDGKVDFDEFEMMMG
ncbi:hypothetical protein ACFE04_001510 [Oxalis oulophora]